MSKSEHAPGKGYPVSYTYRGKGLIRVIHDKTAEPQAQSGAPGSKRVEAIAELHEAQAQVRKK